MSLPDATRCQSDNDPTTYRAVLGTLAKGVTIVATHGDGGPVGATASAVSSLSLDPPLVLVNLARTSRTLSQLCSHGAFSINVLRARHQALAESFSGSGRERDERFASVPYHVECDVPVLADALAWITCRLHATYPGGDHVIVVGAVTRMRQVSGEPLISYRGSYHGLSVTPLASSPRSPGRASG